MDRIFGKELSQEDIKLGQLQLSALEKLTVEEREALRVMFKED